MTKAKLYLAGFAALLILAAAVVGWWRAHERALILRGIQAEQVRALEERDAAQRKVDSLLAVEQVATVDTFVRWRDRWRDSIVTLTFTDTLVHVDTVRQIIHVADSTVRACETALGTCTRRVQSLLSLVANRDSVINILRDTPTPGGKRAGVYLGAGSCAAWDFDRIRPALCVGLFAGVRIF